MDSELAHKMMLAREQSVIDSIPVELRLPAIPAQEERPYTESTNPTTRKTALEQAQAVIYGDREKTYGDPSKNLRVIAEYWSTHLSAITGQNIRLTVSDVCVMMILLKQARLANTPDHIDSIVDTIGYAALLDRVLQAVPVLTDKIDK